MIYTLGYYATPVDELIEIMDALGVETLIDVRSIPKSRAKGYNKSQLAARLGERYQWRGNELGGMGKGPTKEGLKRLANERGTVAIMCMEAAPGECHRHHDIGLPLNRKGVPVAHVFEDHLVTPVDLQKAIDTDTDYDCELWR